MSHELAVNQEHLLQARKMAALGTFTAGIAHELNNPINNVLLSAEGLREDYKEDIDADGQEMIDDIMQQASVPLTSCAICWIFRAPGIQPQRGCARPKVVESILNLLKNLVILSGVVLHADVPETLPDICGDLRSLQQIFMNLLLNAIQATPRGGTVSVRAHEADANMVAFEICDTGPGIPGVHSGTYF